MDLVPDKDAAVFTATQHEFAEFASETGLEAKFLLGVAFVNLGYFGLCDVPEMQLLPSDYRLDQGSIGQYLRARAGNRNRSDVVVFLKHPQHRMRRRVE